DGPDVCARPREGARLPGGQRAGLQAKLASQLPKGDPFRLTGSPDSAANGRRRQPGVVPNEGEEPRQEGGHRLRPALLPTHESARVAADLAGNVLLPQAAIETGLSEVLAERPGGGGTARTGNSGFEGQTADWQ